MSIESGDPAAVAAILAQFLNQLADDSELLKRYLDNRTDAITTWFKNNYPTDSDDVAQARQLLVNGDFQAVRNLFGQAYASQANAPAMPWIVIIWIV